MFLSILCDISVKGLNEYNIWCCLTIRNSQVFQTLKYISGRNIFTEKYKICSIEHLSNFSSIVLPSIPILGTEVLVYRSFLSY